MAASRTGCLVFIDDVTVDRSNGMNSEVFWAMWDNEIKHIAKATKGKELKCYPIEHPSHLLKTKLKEKFPKNKRLTPKEPSNEN